MSTQFKKKPFRIHITKQDNGLLRADCNTHIVVDVSPNELEYIYMPYAGINAQVELICDIPEIKERVKAALVENTKLSHLLDSDHPVIGNLFFNLLTSYKDGSYCINQLESLLTENIPVIIVGAGPNLTLDRMEWIKEQKEEGTAIVIACGSANRILSNNNIYPHFALAFDPKGTEYQALESLSDEYLDNVKLICTTGLHSAVFTLPWKQKFVAPSGSFPQLSKLIEPDVNQIDEGCSGCVTMAVNLVKYLGSNKIVMVGVDLSYGRGNRLYADSEGSDDSDIPKFCHGEYVTKQIWLNEAEYITNQCKSLGIQIMTASDSLLTEFDVDFMREIVLEDRRRHILARLGKLGILEPRSSNSKVYKDLCRILEDINELIENNTVDELINDHKDSILYKGILRSWDLIQSFREVRGCEYNKHLIADLLNNINNHIRSSFLVIFLINL